MNHTTASKEEELSLKLYIVLSRAYKSITEQMKKSVQPYGLNLTEFAVLELLYHKGKQPLQQIGEKILITSGSITYVVDKLASKGYLMRVPCESDRRIQYAHLTDQGEKFMDEYFPQHRADIARVTAGLGLEDKEVAIDLLKKLGFFAQSV